MIQNIFVLRFMVKIKICRFTSFLLNKSIKKFGEKIIHIFLKNYKTSLSNFIKINTTIKIFCVIKINKWYIIKESQRRKNGSCNSIRSSMVGMEPLHELNHHTLNKHYISRLIYETDLMYVNKIWSFNFKNDIINLSMK